MEAVMKLMKRHAGGVARLSLAVALIAVPAVYSRMLIAVAAQPSVFLTAWLKLGFEFRLGLFAAYYFFMLPVAGSLALGAVRGMRIPRDVQDYRIYGPEQDRLGQIEVQVAGAEAVYDVPPVQSVYERFPKKYGQLRLLELFGALYPIVIVAESIALRREDVSCRLLFDRESGHPKRFQLTGDIAKWREEILRVHEKMLGQDFAWFDDLARLKRCVVRRRLIPFGKRMRFFFEVCNYSDYIVTNYSVDLQRSGSLRIRDLLDGAPRRRRGIPSLQHSVCANQLGLNVMLVTRDGRMVVAARGADVFTYPGLDGPPVSGTQMYEYKEDRYRKEQDGSRTLLREKGPATDYFDGCQDGFGIPNPFAGALAQAWEEINLLPEHVRDLRLVGLNRDLTRGGIPDAFFVAHLELAHSELREIAPETARDSWERKQTGGLPGFGPHDIRECSYKKTVAGFRDWLSEHPATPALVSNIYFFLKYLKRYKENF